MSDNFILQSNHKINIAFLRFNIDTVGQNFIYEEAEHFKKYSPIVLCGRVERYDRKINYYCYEDFAKLYQRRWPIFPKAGEEVYRKGIDACLREIAKNGAKLFQAQFLTDAIFYHRLIKKSGLPLVVNLRGHDLFMPNIRSFIIPFGPLVSKFIVKSESMKDSLISAGCLPSKIEVIYGGINTEKIIFKPRNINHDNLRILCAARFVEKKGTDVTLKFFFRLRKKYPNARLTLIGEGALKNKIAKLVDAVGVRPQIEIKEFMEHRLFVRELYRHNIFVLPSRTSAGGDKEGIPNVLKEAMASGMPVISTYHSGIPELICDKETGYLVRENDHSAILDKVEYILAKKEEAFRTCLNARFFVEKKFNVKKTAEQVEKVYDYLLMPSYVRSIVDLNSGEKPLKFRADLHLIRGCNSRCIMCDNWKKSIITSLQKKDASRILKDLKLFGVNYIRFHGQEPTLRKDLFLIMKEAKEKKFKIGLKTNALNLAGKEAKILAGLVDNVYLSLDSPDKGIHNFLRGNDFSFDKNIKFIQGIRKFNPDIKIYFNSVITKFNYQSLGKMLDLARRLRIDKVSFVNLNNKNRKDISNVALSESEFKDFYFNVYPHILEKSLLFNIPISIDPYFSSLLGLSLKEQIYKLKNNHAEFEKEIKNFTEGDYGEKFYEKNICYGVLDHVTIDWEGNVYPCCAMPRLVRLSMGNLRKASFFEIWNSKKYRQYREDILKGRCKFKDKCGRDFMKTAETNNYLEKVDFYPVGGSIQAHLLHQYKYNEDKEKNKLNRMIYYSFAKSEFYQNKFREAFNSKRVPDISRLPVIGRSELKDMALGKEIIPNYFAEEYKVYRTSSCGLNAFFYARPLRINSFHRMAVSFMQTGKWNIGDPWLKLTSLNCLEARHPVAGLSCDFTETRPRSDAIIIPPSEDFINEPLSVIIEAYNLIKNSKANLIHVNPTYFKLLLYRFKKEGLKLDNAYAVHSTYETLLYSTEDSIKGYLNCDVFNQYGCSEIGPVSFRCKYGSNHIFSDVVYVETIPAKDLCRRNIGRVVITHLDNHVMPFVKYFTGDFAYVLKKKSCGCGLTTPLMGDIVGREKEIIYHKNKAVFPLELDKLLYGLNNILLYQIIFDGEKFFVKIVPEHMLESIPLDIITNRFSDFFEDNNLLIDTKKVDSILPNRRGKYASVIVK